MHQGVYNVLRFTWRRLRDDPDTVAERLKGTMSYAVASASRSASSSGSSIEYPCSGPG